MAEEFKVCVESLHSNKIKEINYEGEEILEEKPTASQRFAELAQRVDFTDSVETEESEPPPKKSSQKWPWESPHSKLKQALTEISVLSDVLQITQNHRQYVALDPVLSNPMTAPSSSQQYIVKKKSLERAAAILHRGTTALSKTSIHGEKEFHQTLSIMRRRWRLRRLPNGAIVGDLSYHSAGSLLRPVFFDVSKSETSTGGVSGSGVLRVNVPRDLRGRSEIIVFVSDKPVLDIPCFSSLPPSPMDYQTSQHRKSMPGWEIKLLEAQNVLFNQELFSQIAREAYSQKTEVQQQVFANRINVMLSNDCWLSIIHMREYDGDSPTQEFQQPLDVSPRWHLVVALKQLLREKHQKVSTLEEPRPATSGFTSHTRVSSASVVPLKTKDQVNDLNIFEKFVEKAKHCYNEERLQRWISELCSSCTDPMMQVSWSPNLSLIKTMSTMIVTSPSEPLTRHTVTIILNVDKVSVEQIDGRVVTYFMEKDRLLCVLRHQVLVHQMKLACNVARGQRWNILKQSNRPLLSPCLVKSSTDYMMACGLTLESPDAHKKLDVVLEWDCTSVSVTQFADKVVSSTGKIGSVTPKTTDIALNSQHGHDFQQRFSNLLGSLNG